MDVAGALSENVGSGWCPHLAILVPSRDDVMSALASFYGLGARRNGWLFHRSLPGSGDADRAALADAGLAVAALEADGRFVIAEPPLESDPDGWALRYVPLLEQALQRGFDAAWFSRYPIGMTDDRVQPLLAFDKAWDDAFHGRPAVSLCVYIVDEVDQAARGLAPIHDGLLTPGTAGTELVRTRGRA
jgi:hypothetical protein